MHDPISIQGQCTKQLFRRGKGLQTSSVPRTSIYATIAGLLTSAVWLSTYEQPSQYMQSTVTLEDMAIYIKAAL